MLGKSYDIPEKNKKAVVDAFKAMDSHRLAMDHHAEKFRYESESVWKTIKKLIPEIDTEKFVYSYNRKEERIECSRLNIDV